MGNVWSFFFQKIGGWCTSWRLPIENTWIQPVVSDFIQFYYSFTFANVFKIYLLLTAPPRIDGRHCMQGLAPGSFIHPKVVNKREGCFRQPNKKGYRFNYVWCLCGKTKCNKHTKWSKYFLFYMSTCAFVHDILMQVGMFTLLFNCWNYFVII